MKKPKLLNSQFMLVASRYMGRAHTFVYRISRGRFGGNMRMGAGFRKPAPTLLLEHRGRKSGKRFTVPVIYMKDGSDIVVVASAAGRDEHPQWFRNLMVDPQTHITIGADRRAVEAHRADENERERLWPRLVDTFADFDSYRTWTEREIPVLVLRPR